MMHPILRSRWIRRSLLLAAIPAASSVWMPRLQEPGKPKRTCTNSTVKGRYVYTATGWKIEEGDPVPLAHAGQETFDGEGGLQGVMTLTINGVISRDVSYSGTYSVNTDCSIDMKIELSGVDTQWTAYTSSSGDVMSYIRADSDTVFSGISYRAGR